MAIVLVIYLLVLGIYDIRFQRLPGCLLLVGAAMALWQLIWEYNGSPGMEALVNILKGWLPGILLLGISRATGKVGSGDGCVLLVVGSILGCRETCLVLAVSLTLAAVAAGGLLILGKAGRKDRIPFIPFVAAAVLYTVWPIFN